jgi:hypothetical protein
MVMNTPVNDEHWWYCSDSMGIEARRGKISVIITKSGRYESRAEHCAYPPRRPRINYSVSGTAFGRYLKITWSLRVSRRGPVSSFHAQY